MVVGTFQMCFGGKGNDFRKWIEHEVESEISNSDAEWL